jgi:dolichol-phosphate mannosyltransferase
MTGLMGLYVGRIYNEVKRRPLYVVAERVGFLEATTAEAASRKAN